MTQITNPPAVRVRELAPAELSRWDEMVRGFANHRITHTLAWIWSLEISGFGSPRFLVLEREGEVVGCLPGVVSEVGPFRLFGSPPPGSQTASMGPAFDPQRISTTELLDLVTPFLEQRLGIHHMEITTPDLDPSVMLGRGFRGEPWPTYRLALHPRDERRTLRQLKDSARRSISRGVKQGLEVRFESQESFVNEHYSQLKERYARRGQAVNFGRRRVLECFRALRDAGSLVAVSVYLPNRVNIATAMFTIEGQELVLWSCAHRTSYRWHRPVELMTWTVMQRALSAGCVTFDLTGLGEFRTRFGGELESQRHRWVKSRYKWLAGMRDIAAMGVHWQQSVRGRMAQIGAPSVFRGLEPIPPLRDVLRR
jgi:hypothetical protein